MCSLRKVVSPVNGQLDRQGKSKITIELGDWFEVRKISRAVVAAHLQGNPCGYFYKAVKTAYYAAP